MTRRAACGSSDAIGSSAQMIKLSFAPDRSGFHEDVQLISTRGFPDVANYLYEPYEGVVSEYPRHELGIVHGLKPRPRGGVGLVHGVAVGDQPLAQQPVLLDREVVGLRERECPAVMSPDMHHDAR